MKGILALFVSVATAVAEPIYVAADGDDSNDGSYAAPVRTIQRALESERLANDGEIVVRAGTYEGPFVIGRAGLGPIWVRGLKGARIEMGSDEDAVEILPGGRVIFEGFEIATAGGSAVRVTGKSRGVVLRRLQIFSDGCGDGIVVEQAGGALIERNAIRGARSGIVVGGVGGVVRSNVVTGSRIAGVLLGRDRRAVSSVVTNNTLLGNGSDATKPGGLWIADASGVRVENNIFVAGWGCRLLSVDTPDVFFANNLYFSPNGVSQAKFAWEGAVHRGFSMLRLLTADQKAVFGDPMLNETGLTGESLAIDGGSVGEHALEKDFFGMPRRTGSRVDIGAQEFSYPRGLRVAGNQILDRNQVVRLRGVGVGDPVLDRRDRPLADYRILRERWNANAVRMSMHASVWRDAERFGGRENVLEWFRHEVDAALRADLYVILDWHVIGWPDGFAKPSEVGEPEGLHDSSLELAKDFWDAAAREFGNDGRVAFELWNEPVRGPDDWRPNPADWEELRVVFDELTQVVRRHSASLVIVTGGNWAYGLRGIRENPPSDFNTAIAWHVYAGKEENDERRWAAAFDNVNVDLPVIVTEWGFDEEGPAHYRGGFEDFGEKFARRWLIGRDLHWIAWCWHPTVGPPLLEADWKTPTPFGFVVGKMLKANPRRELAPPRGVLPDGRPVSGQRPLSIN